MLLLCREAVASERRWSATVRAAAWIKRRENERERKTRCNAMKKRGGETSERRREGKEVRRARWGAVRRSGGCRRGSKVNAPQGNVTRCARRAKRYTRVCCYVRAQCVLLHFTTTLSLVPATTRDYVFFWRRLFREFPPTSRLSSKDNSLYVRTRVRDDGFVVDVLRSIFYEALAS